MSDQSRDSFSNNKGPVDCERWHQRRARSLTRRSDRPVHNKNRCRSDGRGVHQFRQASHSENCHFRQDRGQSSGKHNEHSDYDNWCRRRAHHSSYESDRLVRVDNTPPGDGYRVNQIKHASECDSCRCRCDPSQDGVRHTKHSDAENVYSSIARSSSPQNDGPFHNKNRCQSRGHRATRFRHGPEWEDCGARNDRSQDGVTHNERPSDTEKWRKTTAQDSPFPREQPGSRDGAQNNERSSDIDHWRKATARDSPRQSEPPVIKQDRCHSNMHNGYKFKHASDCENRCSWNDHNERSSDLDNWHKTTAHNSSRASEWPVSNTSRAHGDGHRFNPFKQASYCENCHSRNDCSGDSVKPSDCENWRNRRPHSSYRPGVHFVINKNWRHTKRYWINPFKRATHVRNWRTRNDRNKDGLKELDRSSYCKNWRRRKPQVASRYAIWAIFNRKLSHKTQGNRQAVAQFKSDCENWRSWNDRHRDHVVQRKRSPQDKNWRSKGDCVRDQVDLCDQSPDRDVTDQGERDEQRVADSSKDRKETEVQNMHGSDTGRKKNKTIGSQ